MDSGQSYQDRAIQSVAAAITGSKLREMSSGDVRIITWGSTPPYRRDPGGKYSTLRHLEGRIAPKKDVASLLALIGAVVDGYLRFRSCPKRSTARQLRGDAPPCMTGGCSAGCTGTTNGRSDAELALVIHFIKRRAAPTGVRVPQARDMVLRVDLRQQAQVVRQAIERHSFVRQIVRGFDAASNELHAPPEVFAPTYRYLRRHALQRATFHAGEDFVHLVSGIRACSEALNFLTLGPSDRMGHATALGISPQLWLDRTGPRLMIGAGEQLDNLVYAHAQLAAQQKTALAAKGLEAQIALLSSRIYGREHSPEMLHRAWRFRTLDILEILELERNGGDRTNTTSIAEAAAEKALRLNAPARRAELKLIADFAGRDPQAYELFRERHRRGDRLDQLLEVETDWLRGEWLSSLQAEVLKALSSRGVAIETLPTSNVRISAYDRMSEHHLFRWLGFGEEAFSIVPSICVGSDDTGIFATSLRNEYAAIFDVMRRDLGLAATDAVTIVEKLNRNGAAYRFQPLRTS